MYKNILNVQTEQYNKLYRDINKVYPGLSKDEKKKKTILMMMSQRGIDMEIFANAFTNPFAESEKAQYCAEILALTHDLQQGINRYYLKDDNLLTFFKETEVREKEIASILDTIKEKKYNIWGVITKNFSFTLLYSELKNDFHSLTVLTDEMNYTFCIEKTLKNHNQEIYNMALNFLFYLKAFPECITEGVPAGVKKNDKASVVTTSEKIISHTISEHGFVRPHFRSGYFRHFMSDYFVNCKGQVRFIEATMVKGKAYTVNSRQNQEVI